MVPEKSDNWKSRLDELDSLPEPWDKTTAWDKLEKRLQAKRRNPRIFWYWAAAASLIFVLALQLFETREKNQIANKPATAKKSNVHASKPVPVITKENREQPPLASRRATKNAVKTKSPEVAVIAPPVMKPVVTPDSLLANNSLTEKNEDNKKMDTAETIIAHQPAPRPLRVVHINELGKPVEEKKNLAQVRRNSLGSGFVQKDMFIRTTSNDDILKIKLSPNN